ncbi:hypothetical protein VX037_22680 [Gordonia sp. Z-3]|uniref:hypothetical protein n=1 Tax=Gordonia sp. Z-3 TaxID=3115408 RepID=UPI002E2938CD|nr:hypothetical protein [Gordonia sp. Z-3]MED5803838.1 hypothetical protein [Gordonia sp. Z-3]
MFGEGQFSTEFMVIDVWYYLAAFMALLAVAALALMDLGSVRRSNLIDCAVQKAVAIVAGGFGMMWIGYPIWQWQFNQAFGVPNPLGTAIKDWWFGGPLLRTPATDLDPAVVPEADVLQIFYVFFISFGMLAGALLHGALTERVRPLPLFALAFFSGGLLSPFLGYLLWGSMSPLTNNGFHDFAAIAPVYICIGAFSLAVNLVVRPRFGRFEAHTSGASPYSSNPALSLIGVLLLMVAIPFVMVGNGYFLPEQGFYGITFASSGIGMMAANLMVGFVGGGLAGLVIAYRRREYSWALLGPLAGYVMVGAMIDIATPVVTFIAALFGPPLMLVGHKVLERLRIDDAKAPLAVLPGVVGMIVTGFVGWHTAQGGYPGLTGEYEFQGAQVTPWMQVVGVAIALVLSFGTGLVLALVLKRFGGLRIDEDAEVLGQDRQWTAGHQSTTSDVTVVEAADHGGPGDRPRERELPAAH